MATLGEIRTGIMDALSDPVIPGLTAYRSMTGNLMYPCVVPIPKTSVIKSFQRGIVVWDYTLAVLVGGLDGDVVQEELDLLVDVSGPMSISNALYSNRTLGLSNTDVAVLGMEEYLVRFLNLHIGAALKVRVTTSGTG